MSSLLIDYLEEARAPRNPKEQRKQDANNLRKSANNEQNPEAARQAALKKIANMAPNKKQEKDNGNNVTDAQRQRFASVEKSERGRDTGKNIEVTDAEKKRYRAVVKGEGRKPAETKSTSSTSNSGTVNDKLANLPVNKKQEKEGITVSDAQRKRFENVKKGDGKAEEVVKKAASSGGSGDSAKIKKIMAAVAAGAITAAAAGVMIKKIKAARAKKKAEKEAAKKKVNESIEMTYINDEGLEESIALSFNEFATIMKFKSEDEDPFIMNEAEYEAYNNYKAEL